MTAKTPAPTAASQHAGTASALGSANLANVRIVALIGAAVLATGPIAGCSADGKQATEGPKLTPIPGRSSTSTTSPAPTTTSASSTAAPSPGAPMPNVTAWVAEGTPADASGFHTATRDGVATDLGDSIAFITPSGKVQCATMSAIEGLSCLINLKDPMPKPIGGEGQWIGGWLDYQGNNVSLGSFHGDPGPFNDGTGAQLPYGQALKFGEFQCRSDQSGLFCVNFAHQSAVKLSDGGVETFGCLQRADASTDVGRQWTCG